MTAALAAAYPVRVEGEDARFTQALAHDLGAVLELHGFPPVRARADLDALQDALFRFLYVVPGPLGEVQRRLNSGPVVTYSEPGPLTSEDCCATAHELRRLKGADGVLVIAHTTGSYLIGAAVDAGSRFEAVSSHAIGAVEAFLGPRPRVMKEHVVTVDEEGRVS